MDENELFQRMASSIVEGNEVEAGSLAIESIKMGIEPAVAIRKGFAVGMKEVGDRYSREEIFLPDLLVAAEAMKSGLKVLEPEIKKSGNALASPGRVVIGVVKGDIHDIGKSLVATFMGVRGFEVIDLGIDVPAERFVGKVEELKPDILALSSLLSTSAVQMKVIMEELQKANLRGRTKVMIGGTAASEEYALQIGADGYAEDAVTAVDKAVELVSKDQEK